MVKPFEAKEVIARVKAVLRRSRVQNQKKAKEVSYDGLYINMENYELRVRGKQIDTPPKEMELIYHLASNPNRVYTGISSSTRSGGSNITGTAGRWTCMSSVCGKSSTGSPINGRSKRFGASGIN